jgi:GNAT superfamily N-acetyltransferase
VKIRSATPADAAGIARVHVDSWRSTYAGIVPDAFLDGLSYERSEQNWQRSLTHEHSRSCYFVAETEDGQVVGFACGGPLREPQADYRGELYAIYLLQQFQQHGLGRRLVAHVASWLLQHDLATMLIWVLKDNPACSFYSKLGGERVTEKTFELGGATLVEVGYGWADLGLLVKLSDTDLHAG